MNKIFSAFLVALLIVTGFYAQAQITMQATTGMISPQLSGAGAPSSLYTCNIAIAGVSYIQTDSTNGRLWLCDNSSGSLAWDHQINPTIATATSGTITGGSFILGGCTAITSVTIAGATIGANAAVATPIYVSAPTGNQGLFNLTAWVSAANTVTVQGCALGILSSVPNFQAKVLLY